MRHIAPILLLLATLQPAASGQPPSIAQLKAAYLACSDAADRGELSNAEIMYCSVVYEELKRRAFGGDFERLLAWSRSETARARTAGGSDWVQSRR